MNPEDTVSFCKLLNHVILALEEFVNLDNLKNEVMLVYFPNESEIFFSNIGMLFQKKFIDINIPPDNATTWTNAIFF